MISRFVSISPLCAVAMLFATAAAASPQLNESTALNADHFGPITFGMTVEEASKVSGMTIQENTGEGRPSDDCYYVYGDDEALPNAMFTVEQGKIDNVYIYNPGIRTPEKMGIGSDDNEIKKAYHGKWQVRKNQYSEKGDVDIVVKISDKFGYVFFMNGTQVEYFNAGDLTSIQNAEGC